MSHEERAVQAVLFTAHGPVTEEMLAKLLQIEPAALAPILAGLETSLASTGLRLSRHNDGLRLVTAPELSAIVTRVVAESGRAELTKPTLETLSIIAYRGPISRSGIEAIRGVNSEATIRSLIGRELIKGSGQPPVYQVSTEFLDHFGLTSTAELPPVERPDGQPDAA